MERTELNKLCKFLIVQGADYSFVKKHESEILDVLEEFGKPSRVFAAGEYFHLQFADRTIEFDYSGKKERR